MAILRARLTSVTGVREGAYTHLAPGGSVLEAHASRQGHHVRGAVPEVRR